MAEIEAANLQAGEDLALNQERDKLLNHKNIADTLTNAYSMLDNEDFSSLANVRSAMNDMESVEEYDPEYREISSSLSETYYVLEDISNVWKLSLRTLILTAIVLCRLRIVWISFIPLPVSMVGL